ncbi:hypothetical protein HZS_6254 [Henneguya salminicola]|uniref:DNA-directed RNA polymerases I and III subunit rpc19 (Trinotate prediction) n=1 Tax=Henneguya salminicola TaxID=69463 RepID=A0A6G3MLN4_HENSL|nr:hypothetical protein HZS_6254 [Henneguya salminicola]
MADSEIKALDIIPIHSDLKNHHGITCVFYNEDHTLGNVLVQYLQKIDNVNYSGYSIPHPSDVKMNVRIQTIDIFPEQALKMALQHIKETSILLLSKFDVFSFYYLS